MLRADQSGIDSVLPASPPEGSVASASAGRVPSPRFNSERNEPGRELVPGSLRLWGYSVACSMKILAFSSPTLTVFVPSGTPGESVIESASVSPQM